MFRILILYDGVTNTPKRGAAGARQEMGAQGRYDGRALREV